MAIIHRATFKIPAPPERVASFVTDPARVQAYFPGARDGGHFAENSSDAIWVLADTGITVIERISPPDAHEHLEVRVTSTSSKALPADRAQLTAKPMLRFYEDWALTASDDGGTQVVKTWRDVEAFGFMRFLPASWLIRRSAKSDLPKLITAWSAP